MLAWEHRPGEQANLTVDEFHDCDVALRTEPRVIAALERHGIHDLDRVLFDTWAYGGLLVPERHRDRRVGWTDVWFRNEDGSNPYANPLSGLHFVVDMNSLELLEIEDESAVDRPRTMGEYVPRARARAAAPRRHQAARHRAARGRVVHASTATGCTGSAGRCGSASTRARAW